MCDAITTKPQGRLPSGLVGEVIPPDGDEATLKALYRGADAYQRGLTKVLLARELAEVFGGAVVTGWRDSLKAHPAAELFPMSGDELSSF
jgi:hypothetical protein